MNPLNSALAWLASLLMAPFSALPAWVALVFWSAAAGVLMTWAFRYTSSQKGLKRAIDQIRANMLGMKLFKDDLSVTLRCQARLFKGIGMRLWYSLPPMLVMIVPFVLVLTQLAAWYEFRPLRPGEPVIVQLELSPEAWAANRGAPIELPDWVVVESPRPAAGGPAAGFPDAKRHVLNWRIRPQRDESFTIKWKIGGETVEKRVAVASREDKLIVTNKRRPGPGFEDRLLYAAEPGFGSSSAVQSIEVPAGESEGMRRATPIFGLNVPWWGTFLIVSMVAALVAKPFLKVQF